MKKSYIALFVIIDIVIIAGIVIWFWKNDGFAYDKNPIHYHAGFQVYVNGQKQDFSDFKYMKVEPCGDDHDDEVTPESEQLEKAHLHDGNGDVVHIHREAVVWGDLFKNINYPLSSDVQGYVNGQLVPQVLSMPIIENASVVFFSGENTDIPAKVAARVTQERIQEVEAKSENCGTN